MAADRDNKFSRMLFARHILRKIFLEDWALKLMALLITIGLWLGVTGLSTPTKERLTVPLDPRVSNNIVITNAIKTDVEIVISGDKRKVDQINKADLSAAIDLTNVSPGDWVYSLSPDNVAVSLPQGVKLVEVQPSRIPVKLEAVAEKDVEVVAETVGEVMNGYEIYSTSVLPPKIRVRGAASVIETLTYVPTEKIDLAGRREDFTAKQIPVTSPNPRAAVLNTVVDVFFRVGEKRMERSFTIPITSVPGKYASFTLFGAKSLLQKIRSDELKVEMFLNGNGDMTPQVILPPDIENNVEIRRLKTSVQ